MNMEIARGAWHQLKGSAKARWELLTDQDLEGVEGSIERLVGVVQTRYGYSKKKAEQTVAAFVQQNTAN